MHYVFPLISWNLSILLLNRSSWRLAKNFVSNGSLFSLVRKEMWERGEERKRGGGGGGVVVCCVVLWCGGVCVCMLRLQISIKGMYTARALPVRSSLQNMDGEELAHYINTQQQQQQQHKPPHVKELPFPWLCVTFCEYGFSG